MPVYIRAGTSERWNLVGGISKENEAVKREMRFGIATRSSSVKTYFFCAADVFSTAEDLSMWAQHLFNGNALNDESKAKMVDFLLIDTGFPAFIGYGLGVRRVTLSQRVMWGHFQIYSDYLTWQY